MATMLHWFAGAKPTEGPTDPDSTEYVEPPETPAPVFAVRAFKHAIFGTPQTTQPKPRRHSNTENARPRNNDARPVRPGMNRPKSSSDAQPFVKHSAPPNLEVPSSPTKGILLTPRTAAAKRKNVTFGDQVVDNEQKRPLKGGLPDDCPGKYPSPWNKSSLELEKQDEPVEKGRDRSNKLIQALSQARDESTKRKSKPDRHSKNTGEDDWQDVDWMEATSEDGKHWKNEYDIYRTNTQREVKKLITKQKAAKSFARAKDFQCGELADQLRQEQERAEKLETRANELQSQVKDLEEVLRLSQETALKYRGEVETLKRQLGRIDPVGPSANDARPVGAVERREIEHRVRKEHPTSQADPVQRPSEPYHPVSQPEKPRAENHTLRARKSKPNVVQAKTQDDIWAPSLASSDLGQPKATQLSPPFAKIGRIEASGTQVAPLKLLSVNTMSNGPQAEKVEPAQSPDLEFTPKPKYARKDSKASPVDTWKNSPLLSPSLPMHSQGPQSEARSTKRSGSPQRKERVAIDEAPAELSMSVPVSSPFSPDANVPVLQPKPTTSVSQGASATKALQGGNTKENESPPPGYRPSATDSNPKPSAMWNSMSSSQAVVAKRNAATNMMGKDGKEVGTDRIEAARARIAARGRVIS